MRNKLIVGIITVIALAGGILLFSKNRQTVPQTSPTPSPVSAVTAIKVNVVTLSESGFSPASLTIKAGENVTWENKSGVRATVDSNPHPVHTSYQPLNLGEFSDGQSVNLTFDTPGTYNYHNHFNSNQSGTIIVE
ncbi:hypothetical protein A2434_01340 [Candidatus Woesebacteria bacterium RIFOXYC1_FULL_41_14]|uniref:EfeO-type cupredoxin-like domain-containing protein n=4 Tax=Candidatus Woeseibacteriota TaxID=1752722 RepID=A0A0G0UVN2_9BACT|nr:MAG: hypothetical protein UT76_C0042G0005 [Candidatus Woesebacteria bacterium GW2011_GWB1_40_12]KKR54432.1 MAG: hypothetical protein UT93_C0038G0006 [Candidatus Woesebacteria bacterium GW2011_GWF1_40_24]KKS15863.1 MAG: hypothetical protein UU74_C0053G0007 [Candidatus Woesebacteria bacterium GW2011_GWA1_41_7]OGM81185.1 MAG: hypothetical protein A2393_01460 [Candidatus Woesebacteria bacterium RIFOXYB1_FULL_41_13]OGM84925.1 MAG: hypothetical protein A2434_01340 [Candidatus Woesebacteria bacteri